MILSSLLTSVGINLGLCLLFFTLYSVLKKQPGNVYVYVPRLVDKERSEQQTQDFNLERFLPSAGWVRSAWQLSEDELLSISGLDAVVLVRIFIFSIRVFSAAGIIGIFILLPVNYFGNQLNVDFHDLTKKSLDSFSISNVDNGSNWLWIHFSAAYIFTGVVCCLLYYEYRYISSKRVACFLSSKPQPHQFTILVRGIPLSSGRGIDDIVESFFTEYHPSTYLSHVVIRRTHKIRGLINDTEKLYRKLARLKSQNQSQQTFKRDGLFGLYGRKVNILDHYEQRLEDSEDHVRTQQYSLPGEEVSAAFVSFKSRFGAAVALHIPQGINPTEWVTEKAPEPRDVYWPFFSASFLKIWLYRLVVVVAYIALTLLFLIPVAIVQGLANLNQLKTWFPFLEGILRMTVVSQLITGYLPSLVLQLFLSCIPPVMILLSSIQGYISLSQIERSSCKKMLGFTIWNAFFANVLSGSAISLSQDNIFLEPKKIPMKLAVAVPAQASFFISYVVTSGWTGLSSELFRLTPLLWSYTKRIFGKVDFEAPSIPYHSEIPRIVFFELLGVTYFFLAPLILPFVLVYFCMGYIIFRNQMLNVYAPKYDTHGKFWSTVHSSTIFSLVLMHVIAIGIFGLKELPLAASLTIPLPILTLIFNEYCRKRFLPMFKFYPTECLIKKDKADQNEPGMTEFYETLVNEYRDPALMPVQYERGTDSHNSPLLSAEV